MLAAERAERAYERRWLVLAALCLTVLLAVVANLALNVALPTLGRQLHAGITSLQWVVDIYVLCFAGLLLPAGALGDRIGRKAALQIGLLVFAVACFAGAFSTETWELVVSRAVSGIGAALAMPGTLSIVTAVFPASERRTAVAIWASVAGASVVLATTWSGLMLHFFWWGSVFIGMAVLAAVACLAATAVVPESKAERVAALDPAGVVFSIAGVGGLVFGLIEAPASGWGAPVVVGAFALGVLGLVAFSVWELRVAQPMVPVRLFSRGWAAIGALSIAAAYFALFGMYFITTQYLQLVRGFAPIVAGLYGLPAGVAQLVVAQWSGKLVDRYGRRAVLSGGLAAGGAGLAVLTFSGTSSTMVIFLVGIGLLGAGIGLAMPPSTTVVISALPRDQAGVGAAVNNVVREIGGAFGIGLFGSVTLLRYRALLPPEAHEARAGLAQAATLPTPGLFDAARSAYTSGMHLGLWAGVAVMVVAVAVVAFRSGARPAKAAASAGGPGSAEVGPEEAEAVKGREGLGSDRAFGRRV